MTFFRGGACGFCCLNFCFFFLFDSKWQLAPPPLCYCAAAALPVLPIDFSHDYIVHTYTHTHTHMHMDTHTLLRPPAPFFSAPISSTRAVFISLFCICCICLFFCQKLSLSRALSFYSLPPILLLLLRLRLRLLLLLLLLPLLLGSFISGEKGVEEEETKPRISAFLLLLFWPIWPSSHLPGQEQKKKNNK